CMMLQRDHSNVPFIQNLPQRNFLSILQNFVPEPIKMKNWNLLISVLIPICRRYSKIHTQKNAVQHLMTFFAILLTTCASCTRKEKNIILYTVPSKNILPQFILPRDTIQSLSG